MHLNNGWKWIFPFWEINNFFQHQVAFDYVHYARWFSMHHYGMEMLKDTNLEVLQEFSMHVA